MYLRSTQVFGKLRCSQELIRLARIKLLRMWPLTAHQKVDRATLKAFDIKQSEQPSEPAPSNSLEESIAQIWSELLDTGEASTNQSFFELGGHSLLLTHLQNRIRETLGVEIPLSELFEGPTVLQIADRIRASQSVKDAT